MDAVTTVLVNRSGDDEPLGSILGYSALAHVALAVFLVIIPAGWLGARMADEETVVMQISLGGAVGPRDGGLATLSSRPVQEVRPVETKKVVEPVRAPAAAAPEMVEPTKTAPPKKAAAPTKAPAKDPKSRTPTKGAEIKKGSAVAETGATGQGFGLSSGGGGTGGYLDVANFCCPEYIATMLDRIHRNWSSRQGAQGTTMMKFSIERDGTLTGIQVERSSGVPTLDYFSQRALSITRQLPPLPAAYPHERLTVHLPMDYVR